MSRTKHVTNPKDFELQKRFSRASGYGLFSRPVRFLVLETGALALMEEYGGRLWQIFATETNGRITQSPVYKTKRAAELMFLIIAEELAEPELEKLFQKVSQYKPGMPVAALNECTQAGLKYLRLQLADEDASDELHEQAQRLTQEQSAELLRDVRTKYEEMKRQEASYEGGNGL